MISGLHFIGLSFGASLAAGLANGVGSLPALLPTRPSEKLMDLSIPRVHFISGPEGPPSGLRGIWGTKSLWDRVHAHKESPSSA